MENKYTFGAELELADWDRSIQIPEELGVVDQNDITIMNSDGHAADPRNPTRGGEINTRICHSRQELVRVITDIFDVLKGTYTINHSCWLHVHVGLDPDKFTLDELKAMLKKCHKACKWIPLTQLSPVKELNILGSTYLDEETMDYLILRNVTRTYSLPEEMYEKALSAETYAEFWECFKGKRALVNMQSMIMRKTLEFRFFYMSDSFLQLSKQIDFCEQFMNYLLEDKPIMLSDKYVKPYKINMSLEKIYRKTRPSYEGARIDNFTGQELIDLR